MVMGKSVERERTRTFSHTLHRQRRVPQAPLWLPYLWYSREKGMQQTSVRAGGLTIQLICFSSNWAGGNPVLSSTPALHLSPKNTYIHIGPGINGGDSLAYQEKPLSKFWKALMFSIQILFYSDFVQHSSQGSRMLGPTTSRRHVDQSRRSQLLSYFGDCARDGVASPTELIVSLNFYYSEKHLLAIYSQELLYNVS